MKKNQIRRKNSHWKCNFAYDPVCPSVSRLIGRSACLSDGKLHLHASIGALVFPQSLSIAAHDNDVNSVCFVDETTNILASGTFICKHAAKYLSK